MRYPIASLAKPVAAHVRRGHPFIWREALRLPVGLVAGDVIDVAERDGRFVARGVVEPTSPVAFRVWTLDPECAVDAALIEARLSAAAALRRDVLHGEVTGYRLCHGENDGLPGLQCDLYDDVASLRTDGAIGLAWQDRFVAAIERLVRPRAVVVRNPQRDGGAAVLVAGQLTAPVVIREGRRLLAVDVLRGQKTGAFLDQRENHRRIGGLAQGLRVLDCYTYLGGFALSALRAGATEAVAVDISPRAIARAKRHAEWAGVSDRLSLVEEDVFRYLEAAPEAAFDLVIVDPPKFAPNRQALDAALKGYRKLNALAMRAARPGALLATASCSQIVDVEAFERMLGAAAVDAGRSLTVLSIDHQALDHPVPVGFPEGRYLKLFLTRVN